MKTSAPEYSAWQHLPVWAALVIMRDNPSLGWRMLHWHWSEVNPEDIIVYTAGYTYWVSRTHGYVF